MYKGIFTNPALRYIDIEARNQMRDVYDKPTTNFDVAERRFRMDEKLDANAALGTFYDEVRTVEKEIEANETVKSGVERLWRDAKRRKSASEIKTHKDELDKWKNEIEKKEDEIKGKVAGLNPALSKEWGEIEQLRGKK